MYNRSCIWRGNRTRRSFILFDWRDLLGNVLSNQTLFATDAHVYMTETVVILINIVSLAGVGVQCWFRRTPEEQCTKLTRTYGAVKFPRLQLPEFAGAGCSDAVPACCPLWSICSYGRKHARDGHDAASLLLQELVCLLLLVTPSHQRKAFNPYGRKQAKGEQVRVLCSVNACLESVGHLTLVTNANFVWA